MTEYCHLAPLRPKIIAFSKTFFFSLANIVKYFQCLLPTTVECRTYHKQRLHKDYFYDFYNLLPFCRSRKFQDWTWSNTKAKYDIKFLHLEWIWEKLWLQSVIRRCEFSWRSGKYKVQYCYFEKKKWNNLLNLANIEFSGNLLYKWEEGPLILWGTMSI